MACAIRTAICRRRIRPHGSISVPIAAAATPCRAGMARTSIARDGQCYPTGTVPPQYQQGRQQYYGDRYYRRPPQGRYYYRD